MAAPNKKLYNIQAAFRSNPTLDAMYVTSDGLPFKASTDANRHAANLMKKATPQVMPPEGTPAYATTQAAITAAGVVTNMSRALVGVPPTGGAAVPAPAAAVPAPAQLTLAQATEANDKAQAALVTAQEAYNVANGKLTDAQAALGVLPSTANKTAKGIAQKLVNTCTAAIADAKAILENAEFDATMAAQNLAAVPTA